jgi:hypothetical protein
MPTGVHSLPAPHHEDFRNPPLALRARTWLRRRHLDARLADGADPASDRELELRAQRISRAEYREQLARALERVMRDARRRTVRIRPQVPVRRAPILDCSDDFKALIRRLRDGEPVDPRGIALTERLLTDGASPLYHDTDPPLCYSIRSARLALDPLELSAADWPTAA